MTKTIIKTAITVQGETSTLILQQRENVYVLFVDGGTLPDGTDKLSFIGLGEALDEFKSTVVEMLEIVEEIL